MGQQADPPNAAAAASVGSQASIARPGGQQWNPAALNPQQQQQLLLMAAHRNNISAEELKHINPQTRMALINSMNPNNGGAQTQLRPGGAQFEQQMQARMRQQQLLQQQMMQRNAHQQSQQVGGSNGMQVRPPPPGQGHPMAVGSPAPGPASMLGSGVSTPAAGQAGSEGGRRSQGPMQGPQPGTPGLQHARSEQAHAMQTSQGGDGQQPQLNPQQQQGVCVFVFVFFSLFRPHLVYPLNC